MKRRHFIKGAGYVSLLALLQACRVTDFMRGADSAARMSTSIPTGTATSLPTVTSTTTTTPLAISQPVATATLKATPTGTATPTAAAVSPVATPTSTPSPTPTPTPYPPGPPSKLGLFITKYEARVLEMLNIAKPAIIKTLEFDSNYVRGLKEAAPTSLIISRIFLEQMNMDVDPIPLAHAYTDKLLPLATDTMRMDNIDAWEAYNEPIVDTPDKMKRLADFEAERTRILAEHGLRAVVGNFAVGNPAMEFWPHFAPALDAIRQYNGYLGLHEYSAPVMQYKSGALQDPGDPDEGDEGWLTLRYRKVHRHALTHMGYADIAILITECGVDGLVQPRPGPPEAKGWQDFIETWLANGLRNDPPGVYMDQLIWYDEHLQQDDYVKGAAIFTVGTNDAQWESYNLLGHNAGRMIDLLEQYLAAHPPLS